MEGGERIEKEVAAEAILDKHLPGVSSNPIVGMAKGMTLNIILSMPQAAELGLTKEKAESVIAEINKQL